MITSTEKATGRTASAVASAIKSNVWRRNWPIESGGDVFEDDHGCVNENPEIDRPNGNQVRGPRENTISENANNNEHGIVSAAINEMGMSPRKTMRTSVTRIRPTITMSRTVDVVTLMRSVRS